jgi:hypothetical protein
VTALPKVDTKCTTPFLIPTVNGNAVRSFSTHGQLSAAQGSSTAVSRSDIRLIQHLDSSALGLAPEVALNWLLPYPLITPSATSSLDRHLAFPRAPSVVGVSNSVSVRPIIAVHLKSSLLPLEPRAPSCPDTRCYTARCRRSFTFHRLPLVASSADCLVRSALSPSASLACAANDRFRRYRFKFQSN